jgi:hypothetical protein
MDESATNLPSNSFGWQSRMYFRRRYFFFDNVYSIESPSIFR